MTVAHHIVTLRNRYKRKRAQPHREARRTMLHNKDFTGFARQFKPSRLPSTGYHPTQRWDAESKSYKPLLSLLDVLVAADQDLGPQTNAQAPFECPAWIALQRKPNYQHPRGRLLHELPPDKQVIRLDTWDMRMYAATLSENTHQMRMWATALKSLDAPLTQQEPVSYTHLTLPTILRV